jgi:RNA polymerase sigma-70 factor (ECF subfamily)
MDPDFDLLTRWRAGEPRAGEALFARHFASLYRFFRGCGADADELVQITLLACVGARDSFRGASTFRTYMFAIARQKLYTYLKSRHERFDPITTSVAEVVTSVRTELARDEERQALHDAVEQLSIEERTLVELHYWEGIDTVQLAAIFEVPPGTIRVRLHRVRAQLGRHLRAA